MLFGFVLALVELCLLKLDSKLVLVMVLVAGSFTALAAETLDKYPKLFRLCLNIPVVG